MAAMYIAGITDDLEFTQQAMLVACQTLTGQLPDTTGNYPTLKQIGFKEQKPETLKGLVRKRTHRIMADITGSQPADDIPAILKNLTAMKEHNSGQIEQALRDARHRQLKHFHENMLQCMEKIKRKPDIEDRVREELGDAAWAAGVLGKKAFGHQTREERMDETGVDDGFYDPVLRADIVKASHKIPFHLPRLFEHSNYVSRVPGMPPRLPLPQSLEPFLRPSADARMRFLPQSEPV
jgi:hypothetical protein